MEIFLEFCWPGIWHFIVFNYNEFCQLWINFTGSIKNTLKFITWHVNFFKLKAVNFLPVNWAPLTPTSEVGGLEKLVTPSRPAARSRGWTWWWRRPRWWRWWSRGCSSRSWGRRSGAERILGRWSSWCTRRWRWKGRHIPLSPARWEAFEIK